MSQAVLLNDAVLFEVVATSGTALSYQWRTNGVNIPGATLSVYAIPSVKLTDQQIYSVQVINGGGAVVSSNAALTVLGPPGITTQPVDQMVGVGQNVSFSVVASGAAPFSYQWLFNGAPLSGATSSNLTLNAVQLTNAGGYSVIISNLFGSITSTAATLTVTALPLITTQPQSQSVPVSENALLSVVAFGASSYQWRFNGTNLAGATNATLTRTNVRPIHAGGYSVVLTNIGGSVTSSVATLTTTVPAGKPSTLWIANKGATTATGGSPTSWTTNHVVSFDGPNLSYGANSTFGTFRPVFGFNPPQPIRALYFVNNTNRVGNPGSDVELRPGDLLVVFNITTATTVGGVPNVLRDDVLLYRPGPFRDYTNGTFSMLLDNPINDGGVRNIHALTLVESDTYVGNTLIPKGTFLVARSDGTKHMNVYTYRPTSVGPGTTSSGAGTLLLSGSKLGWTSQVQGVDLIASPARLGTTDLAPGSLVVSVDGAAMVNPGTQNLAVKPADMFALDISATEQDATPNTVASAAMLFDGSNVGLDDGVANENLTSLTIIDWVNLTPLIKTQPTNRTVIVGGATNFSGDANGGLPMTYQWNLDGNPVAGATNLTLTLTNIQANQAGGYTLVASNSGGSATSVVATLTVNIPAGIATQPANQAVVQSQGASFAVVPSGTAPFGYQWRFNGTNLAGATGATWIRTNAQTTHAGGYSVVVTNAVGSVTSAVATLTVNVPAGIATQPTNRAVVQGTNVSFSVVPSGTAPFTYQWMFNGAEIPGATSSNLMLSSVQTADAGGYSVFVGNPYGSVTSVEAALTVYIPPTITTQPQSQGVPVGQPATFSVVPGGTGPFTYQWNLNGSSLGSGARNATYTKSSVGTGDAGAYTVSVSGPGGSVLSAAATLTVYVPPSISTQPANQTVVQGQAAQFSVTLSSSGTAPFSYQWNFAGSVLPGATNAILAITNAQVTDVGSYFVVITNLGGSVVSSVRTLTVNIPATITNQPRSLTVLQGQPASFSVGATGTGSLSYQWYLNGVKLGSGSTSATLSYSAAGTNNAGSHTVVVNNSYGSVTSAPVTLTVNVPVSIITQPASQTVILGQSAAFSVVPGGTAPFSYQWHFNGVSLNGATDATLSLNNLKFLQAGTYSVTLSNIAGSVVSAAAFLTVLPPLDDRPVMQNLVVHLPFDGNLKDASGCTNNAVAVGAPNLVSGFIGNGAFNPYTVNGVNHYASLGTNVDLSFGKFTDFTVAFWARLPAGGWSGTGYNDPAFVSNKDWGSGANTGWVLATGDDGRLQWNYTESSGIPRKDYDGPAGVFGNPIWHHVAVTFSRAGDAITYFDGLPVSTNSIAPPVVNGNKTIDTFLPVNIGSDGTGNYAYGFWTNALANPTNGLNMDDLGIWRRVVTPQEICAIYNVGLLGQNLASVSSNNLTLVATPRITQPPAGLAAPAGGNATFTVAAIGGGPISYQWFGEGLPLAGRTNLSLTLTDIQTAQAGNYWVVLTNSSGSVTSTAAMLTVTNLPVVRLVAESMALKPEGFIFQASVPAGAIYVVEASSNLSDWLPIATNGAASGNITFTDTAAGNHAGRFYRISVR